MAEQESTNQQQTGGRFHDDLGELQRDFAKLRKDFGDLISSLADVSKSGAGTAKERLQAGIANLKDGVGSVRQKGAAVADGTRQKIQDHPVASLAIAVGVGYLVGRMLERRRR